jgi:type IV pilus assembly protein PilW
VKNQIIIARSLPTSHQRGFTLIELMVSITIGLVILAALVGVLAANSGDSKTNDRTAELNTDGRFALNSLKQELRQAGYRGYTWAIPSLPGVMGLPTSPTINTCFEAGSSYEAFVSNLRQGVWGADNVVSSSGANKNPFLDTCIPAGRFATGNDILVVRRVSGAPTAVASLSASSVYFHSSYSVGQMFKGATTPTFGTVTPLADFPVMVYVYYISPYTVSATESPLVPSLRRRALGSDGLMADELVVSGIEHMQVQYGRLNTNATTRYLDAIDIPGNSADSVDINTNYQWDEVNSVQIWLLARNSVTEPGYSNTQTYAMGNVSLTKADGYRRQLFSTVVQLRN